MPAVGETITGSTFHQIPGGKGANQAVAAARQDAQVSMIACIGSDAYGASLYTSLRKDAIDVSQVHTIHNTTTGVAGITVNGAGDNSIVVIPGANAALTTDHVHAARAAIDTADVLVCQLEIPWDSVQRAIEIAHAAHVRIILNPAPTDIMRLEILPLIDFLILNETEAAQLSHMPVSSIEQGMTAAKQLQESGANTVILTMGAHGVLLATEETIQHMPAMQVTPIDTTAAGDTFVGTFATAIGRHLSLTEAIVEAQAAAALTVTRIGAQDAIPYREEVLRQIAMTTNR